MTNFLLNDFLIEEHVKKALEEDVPYGDITTDYLIAPDKIVTAYLNTREAGILCGSDVFKKVFKVLSGDVKIDFYKNDADEIFPNDPLAKITGPARHILIGERTALNYIQRLSGIATTTNTYVKAVKDYKSRISDTRKTTPLFRIFEKYAVRVGGGTLHRFCLSDCVMLKDNHIKFMGGIKAAVNHLKTHISHTHKIEVECDTLEQVKQALEVGVDIILLDNMTIEQMKQAVEIVAGKAITEASGGVTLDSVKSIAAAGVDIISSSAIVANAKPLDIALDM